jgi:CRISPR-associated endonuclease Csn1
MMSTKIANGNSYRIGIDVGDRSVGLAAVEYGVGGMPTRILACVSHIHDGGEDPSSGSTRASRRAASGAARRVRRLLRRKRSRLQALDAVLRAGGFDVPWQEVPQTYDAWVARARLSQEVVEDANERKRLLVLAIRHIARHRGWRNPWEPYAKLISDAASGPTAALQSVIADTGKRFGVETSSVETLGQLVRLVASPAVPIRPRTGKRSSRLAAHIPAVLSAQTQQSDSLAELRQLLAMQSVPDAVGERIAAEVFRQERPYVPTENVGRDPLCPDDVRASRSTLEFQEFRVRAQVADLRVRDGNSTSSLTDEQYDDVVRRLLDWREPETPTWRRVAEWLGVPRIRLVPPSVEDGGTSRAPVDRTSVAIERSVGSTGDFTAYWRALPAQRRADLAAAIWHGDTTESQVGDLAPETMAQLQEVHVEAGRAAYGRESLRRMSTIMAERRCNMYEARKAVFNVGDDWRPPAPSLDEPTGQPTVDRVLVIVRRFVRGCAEQWGAPERVVVEHVRSAFLGTEARAEHNDNVTSNRKRNEAADQRLKQQGIAGGKANRRREACIQRQNCVCLYCGATIGLKDSELDHIVAASAGGSSRQENVVAVCRACNADKGNQPFAVWASTTARPGVSVSEALERVRGWNRDRPVRRFAEFVAAVKDRLRQTDNDAVDERSLASTAYAAVAIRERVDGYLRRVSRQSFSRPERSATQVYRGSITAEARRAGAIDDIVRLRGASFKSRFDRRHHAVDAAVLTTVTPYVAETLAIRRQLHDLNRLTGKHGAWKEFDGSDPARRAAYRRWLDQTASLGRLLRGLIDRDGVPVARPLTRISAQPVRHNLDH